MPEGELVLKDALLNLTRTESRELIKDVVTKEYGSQIPELLKYAKESAETTAEFLAVVDKIKDFIGMPKVEAMEAMSAGAQIATSSIMVALQGMSKMFGKEETIVQEVVSGEREGEREVFSECPKEAVEGKAESGACEDDADRFRGLYR